MITTNDQYYPRCLVPECSVCMHTCSICVYLRGLIKTMSHIQQHVLLLLSVGQAIIKLMV